MLTVFLDDSEFAHSNKDLENLLRHLSHLEYINAFLVFSIYLLILFENWKLLVKSFCLQFKSGISLYLHKSLAITTFPIKFQSENLQKTIMQTLSHKFTLFIVIACLGTHPFWPFHLSTICRLAISFCTHCWWAFRGLCLCSRHCNSSCFQFSSSFLSSPYPYPFTSSSS